jgi:hypothetical protein
MITASRAMRGPLPAMIRAKGSKLSAPIASPALPPRSQAGEAYSNRLACNADAVSDSEDARVHRRIKYAYSAQKPRRSRNRPGTARGCPGPRQGTQGRWRAMSSVACVPGIKNQNTLEPTAIVDVR